MKVIYLRWLDSSLSVGWSNAPKEHTGLSEIETVGFILREDRRHIEVVQSLNKEAEQYDAVLSIPRSVILERRILGKRKKAKK